MNQSRGCAPGGWTLPGRSLPHSQALLPCGVLCPLSNSNLSSHIPCSSFLSLPRWIIHTQKLRQAKYTCPAVCHVARLWLRFYTGSSHCCKKLSSPVHNSVAKDLVPWVPCLKLFQPLVTGQSITVSSSGSPTIAGGVTYSSSSRHQSLPLLYPWCICTVSVQFNRFQSCAVTWPLDEASSPGISRDPDIDWPAESGFEESPGPGSSWNKSSFFRTF